ncbi:hypothetical protein [Novosphingobium resinovorum]|uniref:hypothetical protein n=1 Tax=Novosphingobium resinovorum TaxID=158500 RepID=UPI0018D330E6|nr:hypothetical protein [Novosphingobium resinovorum]
MIRVLPPHPTRSVGVRLVMWDKMWEGFGHGKAVRNECEGYFAAMPYDKVPTFLRRLRERESFSRLALQFAILTAGRSGEVR